MDYVKLGRTGLDVSRIWLGCMSYGGGNRGNHAGSLSHKNWVEDCLRCLSGRPEGLEVRIHLPPAESHEQT